MLLHNTKISMWPDNAAERRWRSKRCEVCVMVTGSLAVKDAKDEAVTTEIFVRFLCRDMYLGSAALDPDIAVHALQI